MMKAVIDIGKNMIQLPLLDVQVPISVDTSGHLVIAIDEYPEDGWPPGLTTTVDQYPGAVFVAGRKRDAIDGDFTAIWATLGLRILSEHWCNTVAWTLNAST